LDWTERDSQRQLPGGRKSGNFDRTTAIGLPSAASCFERRCHSDQLSAVEQPEQASAIKTGVWFDAITAKKLERTPTQLLSTICLVSIKDRPQSSMNCKQRLDEISLGGRFASSRASASAQTRGATSVIAISPPAQQLQEYVSHARRKTNCRQLQLGRRFRLRTVTRLPQPRRLEASGALERCGLDFAASIATENPQRRLAEDCWEHADVCHPHAANFAFGR
jgi:hypothetical protein